MMIFLLIVIFYSLSAIIIMSQGNDANEISVDGVELVKAAKKPKTPRYFAFVLAVGKVEYAKTKKEAKVFEKENSEIIVDKIESYTKEEFERHKNTAHAATPLKPKGLRENTDTVSSPVLTKEEQARMKAVLARIKESRAGDYLEVHYKTSSKATIAIFCLRFKNAEKKDDWRIKTNHLSVALTNTVVEFPCSNPLVNDALLSLDYGMMRDNSASPNTAVSKSWTSPKDKIIVFYEYVVYGHFPIPVYALHSAQEETGFIENTCKEIGKAILTILQEEYFKPAYEAAINRPNVWNNIADANNVNKQYWSWAKSAQVRVLKCESLNRHLILNEATELVGKLYESNQATVKFPSEREKEEDSDDGSDDSDETSQGTKNEGQSNSSGGNNYAPKAHTPCTRKQTQEAKERAMKLAKKQTEKPNGAEEQHLSNAQQTSPERPHKKQRATIAATP